jgi:hypothetical protein
METFIDSNLDNLIKIYIQERQNNRNELGIIHLDIVDDKVDVRYIPLSNPILTNDLRNDIIEKNNYDNSLMFVVYNDKMFIYDLRK